MPVSPVTNEFMRALPPALRPNPYGIDEYVMAACEKGWLPHQLAEACYTKDRNPNPAFVATNVKSLSQYPPTQTKPPTGWQYGHIPCGDHPNCEICRCTAGEVVHHTPVPMPEWFQENFKNALGNWGHIPND